MLRIANLPIHFHATLRCMSRQFSSNSSTLPTRQRKPIWSVQILAAILLAASARGQIVNGGFETGDLSGWTASSFRVFAVGGAPNQGIPGPGDPPFGWAPSQGSTFAWLLSGESPGVYTTLSQTFGATAGDVLSFDTYFDAGDFLPYNDNGYVRLVNLGDNSSVALYAKSVADVGDFGGDGWRSLSHVISADGTYTLEAGVTEGLDFQHHSALGLDNVALVPEPASLVLCLVGGLVAKLSKRGAV